MTTLSETIRKLLRKTTQNRKRTDKLCEIFRSISTCKENPNEAPIFQKILIANRGEIACRIISTLKKLRIKSVAVYSIADSSAKHVKLADESYYIGPAPATASYLNISKILEAIKLSGAEAVHPGYGFLSENPKFVEMLEAENIIFIGPSAKVIKGMGDKLESKRLAMAAGVNTIPGYDGIVTDENDCIAMANEIGYPIMIKASSGGGGKGMRIARNDDETREGYRLSKEEALSSFADERLIIEKYIENPRHIEIQVLGDKYGNTVYLHERECSIQRRNQKVIEEAPSTFLDEDTRKAMGAQAIRLCNILGYSSAGTVEFLVDENKNFYFLEMNTRLQVEHPVTEYITGIDIVEQMVRISNGQKLNLKQEDIKMNGWAIETRIYAEDPYKNFGMPNVGKLYKYIEPEQNDGIRCDSGIDEGSEISIYYDPLISKLVSHGKSREDAINKAVNALDKYVIRGVTHNIPLVRDILTEDRFLKGQINTSYLDNVYPKGFHAKPVSEDEKMKMLAATAALFVIRDQKSREYSNGPKILIHAKNLEVWNLVLIMENENHNVNVRQTNGCFQIKISNKIYEIPKNINLAAAVMNIDINGNPFILQMLSRNISGNYQIIYKAAVHNIKVLSNMAHNLLKKLPQKVKNNGGAGLKKLKAPMSGLIKNVTCKKGDIVEEGAQLCVIEAMKMQNSLTSTAFGKIKTVAVAEGDTVGEGDVLIILE